MLFYELLEACEEITGSKKEAFEMVRDIIDDIKDNAEMYLNKLAEEVVDCQHCPECYGEARQESCGGECLEVYGTMAYREDYVLICRDCGEEI